MRDHHDLEAPKFATEIDQIHGDIAMGIFAALVQVVVVLVSSGAVQAEQLRDAFAACAAQKKSVEAKSPLLRLEQLLSEHIEFSSAARTARDRGRLAGDGHGNA